MATLTARRGPDHPDPPGAPNEVALDPPADLAELVECARHLLTSSEAMHRRLRLVLAMIEHEIQRQQGEDELSAAVQRHPAGKAQTRRPVTR